MIPVGLHAALQFLTRLPVPPRPVTVSQAGLSLPWYPLVGLLLGAIAVLPALATSGAQLAAAMYVALLALLSGGLHLDGLADTADAWVGGLGDRERTLAIMKEPNSGPAGVTAIGAVLLLKFGAVATLFGGGGWVGLLIAPTLARTAVPLLLLSTRYIRPAGLGQALSDHMPRRETRGAAIAALAVPLLLGWPGLVASLTCLLSVILSRKLCVDRIGGVTGDTLGAAIELTEVMVLVALAM